MWRFMPGRGIFLARSELNRPVNGLLALVVVIVVMAVAAVFFYAVDGTFLASTLVTQAVVMAAGLTLVSQMILRRDKLKAGHGELAFSIAFRWFAIPGMTLIIVGLGHLAWIEGTPVVPREIRLALFWYLLITGSLLWFRAIIVFGLDNLSMLYVYFPQDSRLVDSKIYGVLRHPVYSAAMRIAFSLVIINGSPFALFAGVMTPLSMWLWVRAVEEAELIERFGEGYRQHRARVPAFFNLDPRTWVGIWRFMVTGQ